MLTIFTPIYDAAGLPPVGLLSAATRERHDLDFKVFASKDKMAEHGKDIAAFANTLGSTLIVGAKIGHGIVSYPGLSTANPDPRMRQSPSEVVDIYEQVSQDQAVVCGVAEAARVSDGLLAFLKDSVDGAAPGILSFKTASSIGGR